jgi:two-component system, NtrC family, response regulator AtoC
MGSFPHTVKDSRRLRVLVVEDERLIRWAIGETLALAGHTVVEAEDGATAVRALSGPDKPFDVVLLDYRLPDSNDLTLLARVRRLSPRTPVILMTAYGAEEVTKDALDLGVYGIMNKPFEMHDLEEVVVRASGSPLH